MRNDVTEPDTPSGTMCCLETSFLRCLEIFVFRCAPGRGDWSDFEGLWALCVGRFRRKADCPGPCGVTAEVGCCGVGRCGVASWYQGCAGRSFCLSTSVPLPLGAAANEVRNDVSRHGFPPPWGNPGSRCAHRNDLVRHPRRMNRNDLMRHAERCHRTRHPLGHNVLSRDIVPTVSRDFCFSVCPGAR